jgi:integrase
MTQLDAAAQNGKSAKGMQKQNPSDSPRSGNRFSTAYWEGRVYRPTYTRDGERIGVSQYFIQIAHGGRRHAVALTTNNLDEAARRAVKLYRTLKQSGWDAALRLFRPDAEVKNKGLTIGAYLSHVEDLQPLPVRTFANYSYALRRIAGDIAGNKMAKGAQFDPKGRWKKNADEIPLATLSPAAVDRWRLSFLKPHRSDSVAEMRAKRSVNSYLRNARALFSRPILEVMRTHHITLPDPLPFAGVALERNTGSTRYHSTISAGTVLASARAEFAETNPDAYAVVLLALGAGLRRSEIDHLQRQNILPEKGVIRVLSTAQKKAKTDDSEGDIHVDAGLLTELKRVTREGSTLYVVQPDREYPKTKAAQVYRCDKTFDTVNAWLRKQGLNVQKPTHTMRKEFGTVLVERGDIFQASRQLRHTKVSTTESFYADARKLATVPVGELLKAGSV